MLMLLTIDSGNSNLTLSLYSGVGLGCPWRILF